MTTPNLKKPEGWAIDEPEPTTPPRPTGKENEAERWTVVQAWALAQRRQGLAVLFSTILARPGSNAAPVAEKTC